MRGNIEHWLLSGVCALAPVMAVVAARTVEGPKLASAGVVKNTDGAEQNLMTARETSGELLEPVPTRLRERIASPFYAPPKGEPPVLNVPSFTPEPTKAQIPDFELTSVASGARPAAVINGKLRTQGQSVMPGWIVKSIDPASGRVVLEHAAEGEITLGLRRGRP